VEDGLRGDDGFDESASSGGRNIHPMPRDKLGGRLVHKRLNINILSASMGERQSKVLYREGRVLDRQALHNVAKINIGASNRDGDALVHICD
jgi:hypothetical protein